MSNFRKTHKGVSVVHYQIFDKYNGDMVGHGYKTVSQPRNNSLKRVSNTFNFAKRYNESHKNRRMEIVSARTIFIPKNEELTSRYFKVKRK